MLISKFCGDNIEAELLELETKYCISLASEYKEFILKYNGGDTPKTQLTINKISIDIKGFYGFTDKNKYLNLSYILEDGLGEDLIKKFLLPIATNVFGDYIVMNVSDINNGEISFVYHDNPHEILFISSNFKDFISMCKSEKIGHIRSIEERKQCLIDSGKEDKITVKKIECWQKEIDKYIHIKQEKVIL